MADDGRGGQSNQWSGGEQAERQRRLAALRDLTQQPGQASALPEQDDTLKRPRVATPNPDRATPVSDPSVTTASPPTATPVTCR